MVLNIEGIKKRRGLMESENAKEIFNNYLIKPTPQFLIVENLIKQKDGRGKIKDSKRVRGVLRNLVSLYTRAWVEMGFLKREEREIPKEERINKRQNNKADYYSVSFFGVISYYLKETYGLTPKEIEYDIRLSHAMDDDSGLSESKFSEEWRTQSVKELFDNFFHNPKIKKYILENYSPEFSFPEFLWTILSSINHNSWSEEPEEDFKTLLMINKKTALQIARYKRFGEWFKKQGEWYKDASEIPDKWVKDLDSANEMFEEYYLVFHTLWDNKKLRTQGISKNTKDPDEKELLNLLK